MSDLAEHNRQHFEYVHTHILLSHVPHSVPPTNPKYSKVATTHQNDFGELIEAAIREFKAQRGWITPALSNSPSSEAGKELRVLDYACGAGTVSKVSNYTYSFSSSLFQSEISRMNWLTNDPNRL
jgi:hypothetical protein